MKIFSSKRLTLVLMVVLLSTPAIAHHNYVAHYDMNTPQVTITGTVHSFWFVNPHIRIYINVLNEESGENVVWIAEGRSRNILAREGWKGDEIKKDDTISVSGTPSRSAKMKTHILIGDAIEINGEVFHAGPLEKRLKDFQLGGDGAATSGSHLDDKKKDAVKEGVTNDDAANKPEQEQTNSGGSFDWLWVLLLLLAWSCRSVQIGKRKLKGH